MTNRGALDGVGQSEGWTVRQRPVKPLPPPDPLDVPPGFEHSVHRTPAVATRAPDAGGAGQLSLVECKRKLKEASSLLQDSKAALSDGLESIKNLRVELTVRSCFPKEKTKQSVKLSVAV
jgi:hypothetical protein